MIYNKEIINCIACGQSGDLIHELFVLQKLNALYNIKFNLYIADYSYGIAACGDYSYSLEKTYDDWSKVMSLQPYINFFGILPRNFNEEYINLNIWRDCNPTGSWSELLSKVFNFSPEGEYRWIHCNDKKEDLKEKILIHQSVIRHNYYFNWLKILSHTENEILFITNKDAEYEQFKSIFPYIQKYAINDIYDLLLALNSCKLFVGNQSMPLAMASALDLPRIAILQPNTATYYQNEINFSKNLSWFVDENNKFNSNNVIIQI